MTDQTQAALSVVDGLRRLGAKVGARQVLFNAAIIAEREAAQVRDRTQSAGRRVKAEPHPTAANDHGPDPSSNTA